MGRLTWGSAEKEVEGDLPSWVHVERLGILDNMSIAEQLVDNILGADKVSEQLLDTGPRFTSPIEVAVEVGPL